MGRIKVGSQREQKIPLFRLRTAECRIYYTSLKWGRNNIRQTMKMKNKMQSYSYINERIGTTRLKVNKGYLTIIGVYAPEKVNKEESENFYVKLQKQIDKTSKSYNFAVSGDFNGKMWKIAIPGIVRTFGEN